MNLHEKSIEMLAFRIEIAEVTSAKSKQSVAGTAVIGAGSERRSSWQLVELSEKTWVPKRLIRA
jgi:hypothetical protein